jgi:hypothetical protein
MSSRSIENLGKAEQGSMASRHPVLQVQHKKAQVKHQSTQPAAVKLSSSKSLSSRPEWQQGLGVSSEEV